MIRILNLNPLRDIAHRGITTHLVNIFARLSEKEFEFFSFLDNQDFAKGSIQSLEGSPKYFHSIPFGVLKMKKLKPDIILGTGSPYEILFLWMRPKGTRYVVGWHGPFSKRWLLEVGQYSLRARMSCFFAQYLVKKAELILCDSEYIRRSFPRETQRKIFITSNGVDSDFFNPARKDKIWFRNNILSREKAVAVFIGHLIKRKRPNLFALLASRIPEVDFILVGREGFFDAKQINEWEKKIPNLRWIEVLNREDMAKLLASADCLVFPTLEEPFGFTTIEAMASGLPVVATRSGATPEILIDGEGGYLVSCNEEEIRQFTEKIREVCTFSAEERSIFTEKSRDRAKIIFNWEKVADNYKKSFLTLFHS